MYPREYTLRLACVRTRLNHYCSVTVLHTRHNYTITLHKTHIYTVTLQVLSKINVLWNMTLCWLVIRYRCFGETWCHRVQRDPRLIIHSCWIDQHSAIPQMTAIFKNVVKTSDTNRYLVQTAHITERCCALNQRFSNFFQVGITFISQNVLRTTLLLRLSNSLGLP